MGIQEAQNTKMILKRKNKIGALTFLKFRQIYSNQDNMVLAQKQKYRSMQQDRKPRDKPTHLWSTNV